MSCDLRPYLPELTIRDYNTYLQYRRGVKYQLYKQYGIFSCWILRDDMVALALMADSIAGRTPTVELHCEPGHFFRPLPMTTQTKGLQLAAGIGLISARYRVYEMRAEAKGLRDRLVRFLFRTLLWKRYERACERNPELDRIFQQQLAQYEVPKQLKGKSYEAAAAPYSNVYGAVLAHIASPEDTSARKMMYCIGSCVGRITYLLERAERSARDEAAGRYNVFCANGLSREAALENARRQCGSAIENLTRVYNMLDVKIYRSLLNNLVVIGLRHTIDTYAIELKEDKWEYPAILH